MPPFLPKKRLRSASPDSTTPKPQKKPNGKARASTTPRMNTLFDELDAGVGPRRSANKSKAVLKKLVASDDDNSSSLSSLSSSEEEFEDVPLHKRQKIDSEDEDDDVEFEDVDMEGPAPEMPAAPTDDLDLTLTRDTRVSLTNPFGTKKGPTKNERMIRTATHQIHVQMLMWHNSIRNAWCCDKKVQEILVKQCPAKVMEHVDKWRRTSGLEVSVDKKATPKGKSKGKIAKGQSEHVRRRGDWGGAAKAVTTGEIDMSGGDPIFRLFKVLNVYWKKRFRIVAPGLRKLGYKSLARLDEEAKSFYNDDHDVEQHGERIVDIEDFRNCARKMEGSRDVGAQLYTAFIRGLGIEARLIASLQPLGFGWSQVEEAAEKNPRKLKKTKIADLQSSDEEQDGKEGGVKLKKAQRTPAKTPKAQPSSASKTSRRKSGVKGEKNSPIELEDDSVQEISDDDVIDVTPGKQKIEPSLPYDTGMHPIYWTEVLSPITNTYTPMEAIAINIQGTSSTEIEKFEVRTAKQEKMKQVTAYIIGHSSDGTAKDVTTRYLRNQMWPSKTKGFRIGVEKIPIYNRHGKVKRYEHKDWFRSVMSCYVRGTKQYPRTEADDIEDTTSLRPNKPEKVKPEDLKESLQFYKASKEYVLERFLKREEALLPHAKHVKTFAVKGTKGQPPTDEKVFLRKDVVSCKSTETWHKEGRAPIPLEEPRKRVPYRVATTTRRRELAEAEHATGEKMLQGLFSKDQTEYIIPPPIENGIIPKNSYGNIDLFVDSMLPEGAVHIPHRRTAQICKRLDIDFAEAVTGFEFGNRMAVPVITGVVVAEEHYDTIMEQWEKDEAERVRKEDEKRRDLVIKTWRKMLMSMRVVKRVREDYGGEDPDAVDAVNPFTRKDEEEEGLSEMQEEMRRREEDMAGGFFHAGHDEEEVDHGASYFPVASQGDGDGGGFVVEDVEDDVPTVNGTTYATPQIQEDVVKLDGEDAFNSDIEPESPNRQGKPSSAAKATKRGGVAKPRALNARKVAIGKVKMQQRSDSEIDRNDESSLSSPPSEPESEGYVVPKATRKTPLRKRAPPANPTPSVELRKTPKRAAKKRQTELTSPYFERKGNDDDHD